MMKGIKKFFNEIHEVIVKQPQEYQRIYELLEQQKKEIEDLRQQVSVIYNLERDVLKYTVIGADTIKTFQNNWQLDVMKKYKDTSVYKNYNNIKEIYDLLTVRNVKEKDTLCRAGRNNDGGYVICNKFTNNKIAYSFGINDDVSWDKFMVENGFDVYMYDHTIDGLPEENEKFHWKKIGLSGVYQENTPELRTLPMLLHDNGHDAKENMILKMDIEGAEWKVFENISDDYLKKFDQIVLELHGLNDEANVGVITKTLKKINKTHQLVHLHGNNWENYTMYDGMVIPHVVECTYLKKDVFEFCDDKGMLPEDIDQVNNVRWPDIFLG